MSQAEVQPFIPIDTISETVFSWYGQELRNNPEFLSEEIRAAWDKLDPAARQAFEIFHATLFPDNMAEQQLAARRTLLAPRIEREVKLSERLDAQFNM